MNIKNLFWTVLSVTASFVAISCSNDNEVTESSVAPQTTKQIPYTLTVGYDTPTTNRATVDDDNTTLRFAAGDKLYITGKNIKGILNFNPELNYIGETYVEGDNVFSGTLEYTGAGTPAPDLELTATLVSAQQHEGTEISVNDAGAVTVNTPTTLCTDLNEAVQKYSNLTATFPYGDYSTDNKHTIMLTQQTAFINVTITFEDGTTAGTSFSTKFTEKFHARVYTGNVNTIIENEKVVAKFTLPIESTTWRGYNLIMKDNYDTSHKFLYSSGRLGVIKRNHVYNLTPKIIHGGLGVRINLDTTPQPLTMQASTNGSIKIINPKVGMKYSKNGGIKTTVTTNDDIEIPVDADDKVQFYGNGTNITKYDGTRISGGTAVCKIYGNIMSLVNEFDFATSNTTLTETHAFASLFYGNTTLTDAQDLVIPATTLTDSCYMNMFYGCDNLIDAPIVLPATTLVKGCYHSMFYGCTGMRTSPMLPAMTLVPNCYYGMFNGCKELNGIICMATDNNATNCTKDWLKDVKAEGTFTKAEEMASWSTDANGIPSGWTVNSY